MSCTWRFSELLLPTEKTGLAVAHIKSAISQEGALCLWPVHHDGSGVAVANVDIDVSNLRLWVRIEFKQTFSRAVRC